MTNLTEEIGAKIKFYRQKSRLTLQELADAICKSRSTVSKYENGLISIDIVTLYDIARVLNVRAEQLLYQEPVSVSQDLDTNVPSFFKDLVQFYVYFYDGRNDSLCICVIDVSGREDSGAFRIALYMNIDSYDHYQNCENTYVGQLKHYDALSNMTLQNVDTPMEQITISILAPYLNAPEKWGLFYGISSRPIMPVSAKVLITKKIQQADEAFIRKLRISKQDIKFLKLYNSLTIL